MGVFVCVSGGGQVCGVWACSVGVGVVSFRGRKKVRGKKVCTRSLRREVGFFVRWLCWQAQGLGAFSTYRRWYGRWADFF